MHALDGIKVLEVAQVWAAPAVAMYLADQGAEVVKIEPLWGDDSRRLLTQPPISGGESRAFLSINRNKRGLTVNFKTSEGQRILHQLAEKADVFIVNIPRLGSLRRGRIDPETLRALNPRLIYCAISGYGHTGPKAGRGGYDVVAQGEGGLMSLTGG